MNVLSFADFRERFAHRLRLRTRRLDLRRRAAVFSRGDEPDTLQRIYVINLDRTPERWYRVRRELDRFHERHGKRLSAITRRFSAIDATHMGPRPDSSILTPTFTLADQLAVSPNPLLQIDDEARAREIIMTRQEIAIALSHIEVWKLIANGDVPSALVLEDDVFMVRGFARDLQATWSVLTQNPAGKPEFDLLFLAFRDVSDLRPPRGRQPVRRRLRPGIWEASGYVLTRDGARRLLSQLPAYGPVDLWLNFQFPNLKVFTAVRPIIEQRIDEPSTNSYSVLPVLSQVGVITREKPLVATKKNLKGPVIAVGEYESGMTALGKALSMLGYTCYSDRDSLPSGELAKLLYGQRNRLFNAYVNVGSLDAEALTTIAAANPDALFITTSARKVPSSLRPEQLLQLEVNTKDRWAILSNFLEVDYPPFPYPDDTDLGQRPLVDRPPLSVTLAATDLRFDVSPWILRLRQEKWNGISMGAEFILGSIVATTDWTAGDTLGNATWKLRDDTFPSNLALFTAANFIERVRDRAVLTLKEQTTPVREFTSAAIASRESYLYGSFRAELRPSNVPGLITGVFLHRNGPRQEIDIEFLGKDTTKMLVNVYYNPGPDSTKLEYGYRGTPTLIDLGFDAATDFHIYEIDWRSEAIRWKVDGTVVYERVFWDPTPIPDQPLEFNVNLWHSRSTKFAGKLATKRIPASAELRSIEIRTVESTTSKLLHVDRAQLRLEIPEPYVEISLGDPVYFESTIGDRVLKAERIDGGEVPIYSANVKTPFGFTDITTAEDFSKPSIIWGIDGIFDWNLIPAGQSFEHTDHCGRLQLRSSDLDAEYVLLVLQATRGQYGFDRVYRASLGNLRSNVTVRVPLDSAGNLSLDRQTEIASAHRSLLHAQALSLEALDTMVSARVRASGV